MKGTTYILYISCVDGETGYEITSPNKAALRGFLRQYDHEGSCVSLVKRVDGVVTWVAENPEATYHELEESGEDKNNQACNAHNRD